LRWRVGRVEGLETNGDAEMGEREMFEEVGGRRSELR
jgi:hypothetical protein